MKALFGILALGGAMVAWLFQMYASHQTRGGRLDQNPCIAAAAIQVPLLTMLGLSLLDRSVLLPAWPWWLWPAAWLVETVILACVTLLVGDIAHRQARKSKPAATGGQEGKP